MPYQFTNDTDLVVQAQQGAKTATCIAELACEAAQFHGVTERSLDDHTLQKNIETCLEEGADIFTRCGKVSRFSALLSDL